MRILISLTLIAALSGCSGQAPGLFDRFKKDKAEAEAKAPDAMMEIPADQSDPELAEETTGDPFETAVENPETTTAEAALADTGDGRLGITVASLGDPTAEGFWMKTPLVTSETAGRVVFTTSGRSVQVRLIPSGGPAGGGSQISLAAMRLLEAPLTGLPELVVYSNPA